MSFANKLLNFIGVGTEEDEDGYIDDMNYEDDFQDTYAAPKQSSRQSYNDFDEDYETSSGKRNKVVKIHTTAQLKLVVMQPESFEEARDIANHLKSKKPVVMNLESVEKEVARRIVDFLSGAVFALDGNIQKVANGIFLIAPYNVGIMGDFKDELRNKGIFPWNS